MRAEAEEALANRDDPYVEERDLVEARVIEWVFEDTERVTTARAAVWLRIRIAYCPRSRVSALAVRVGVLGATGAVGQRLIQLLDDHPTFELAALTASEESAGKRYDEAAKWRVNTPIPDDVAAMEVGAPTRRRCPTTSVSSSRRSRRASARKSNRSSVKPATRLVELLERPHGRRRAAHHPRGQRRPRRPS